MKPLIAYPHEIRNAMANGRGQFRRIVKLKEGQELRFVLPGKPAICNNNGGIVGRWPIVEGDLLWARETWAYFEPDREIACGVSYDLGAERVVYKASEEYPEALKGCWRSPVTMPDWASRLTLRVTGVRVERLQEISGDDAWDEGVPCSGWHEWDWDDDGYPTPMERRYQRAIEEYEDLWESIHGKGSWDANPWVWVYEFEVVR